MIDKKVQVAPTTRAYRAGIWAMRLTLLILAVDIVSGLSGAVRNYLEPAGIWFLVASGVLPVSGYTLLYRAGVRVFGVGEQVWDRRRMVYTDIFRLGRRGTSTK